MRVSDHVIVQCFASRNANIWYVRFHLKQLQDLCNKLQLIIIWAGFQQVANWHVPPLKTQISLRIRTVWSTFNGCSMGSQGSNISSGRKLRLIRLCRCTGWSGFLMGTHANLYLMLDTGSFKLSRVMWFPTIWRFDKCRLRPACAASF